jgi:hypothetical protein
MHGGVEQKLAATISTSNSTSNSNILQKVQSSKKIEEHKHKIRTKGTAQL